MKYRLLARATLGLLLTLPKTATAADLGSANPRPPSSVNSAADWNGVYIGGHLGYAAGASSWTATEAGAGVPTLSGSTSLFNSYDAFKGTGSYLFGLQAGYNRMLSSRVLFGIEGDFSAPNTLGGERTVTAPASGQAGYRDTVLGTGTFRGRIGYDFNPWLLYATGGLAWSYDRLERTQLAGTAFAAAAGDVDTAMFWRLGWAAGLGVEVPIAPGWSAKLEFLDSEFAHKRKAFTAAGQTYDSDLSMQRLQLGLNYQLGTDPAKKDLLGKGIVPPELDNFAVHGQTTITTQYDFPFRAPYAGRNSLDPNIGRETFDLDLFVGFRPWDGAEIWINPEIDQGFGLSGTFGVAGFPSGEAYKVGSTYPYARIPRAFLRQTIDLGGESQKVEAGPTQFAGSQTSDRLVVTVGKFGVVDIFDQNKYAHDPRADFLNWTLVNTGTFDYAADAWAFTYGAAAEWYTGRWTVRAGVFDGPVVPNSTDLDPKFGQFQMVGELERRYELWGQPGKILVTGYLTRARLANFQDAVAFAAQTGAAADLAAVRTYQSKLGISANWEQQILPGLGVFARAGYTPGRLETYAFTDVDRTFAAGTSVSGKFWGRPDDTLGLAGVINQISPEHQAYLAAGGYTPLIGDGQLPHPGAEKILEAYYTLPVFNWQLTFDYQFIVNPAYNRDRGPVSIIGSRLHAQF